MRGGHNAVFSGLCRETRELRVRADYRDGRRVPSLAQASLAPEGCPERPCGLAAPCAPVRSVQPRSTGATPRAPAYASGARCTGGGPRRPVACGSTPTVSPRTPAIATPRMNQIQGIARSATARGAATARPPEHLAVPGLRASQTAQTRYSRPDHAGIRTLATNPTPRTAERSPCIVRYDRDGMVRGLDDATHQLSRWRYESHGHQRDAG